jgi:dienelactone hydrolase
MLNVLRKLSMLINKGVTMKRSFLLIVLFACTAVYSQNKVASLTGKLEKPSLDLHSPKDWASIGGEKISNNGKYIYYSVFNQPAGKRTGVAQAVSGSWKKEFLNASTASFTSDSKHLVLKVADSLGIIDLEKVNTTYIPAIKSYKLSAKGSLLAVQSTGNVNELLLVDLKLDKTNTFSGVYNFELSPDGQNALLETRKDDSIQLQLFSPGSRELKTIYKTPETGFRLFNITFGTNGKLAFFIEKKNDKAKAVELWYYSKELNSSVMLVNDQLVEEKIGTGLLLADLRPEFDKKGNKIFFHIVSENKLTPDPKAVQVDIWSYLDAELQSVQLAKLKQTDYYKAVFNIQGQKLIRLEQDNERIVGSPPNDFVLMRKSLGNEAEFESNWNIAATSTFYLVSTDDGSRKLIKDRERSSLGRPGLSPTGKWVIYYNISDNDYYSYEVSTGITRNITRGANTRWTNDENDYAELPMAWDPWGKTWLANDNALLIYDTYDIWEIDPSGKIPPRNFTNYYGMKHRIKFDLVDYGMPVLNESFIEKKSAVYLRGVNLNNKERGFFVKRLGADGDPDRCIMGPYVFGWWGEDDNNYLPIRARNDNTYLVMRMSAGEAPNLFSTKDFRSFTRITDINPQKKYNWYITELHNWYSPDGKLHQGILYKPENFDSARKYPVIFDYYDKRSEELNLFIWPEASESRINIPLFVSNGYLVFTPDMYYKPGQPGISAYHSILSAADYVSKLSFVDSTKMGIQGHSFGGYETNVIIAHTNRFAAACSASGISNLVSWYGADARGSYPKYWAEQSQGRLGKTPWDSLNAYLSNSPILQAEKVSTPLLMMNNKSDEVVPFAQGVEFFTALRRLGKRVWMLQYDGEDHSLNRGKAAEDFHKRMMQFFDHYLKGAPAPKWMTKGIPARLKGIDNGFEIDQEVKTPGQGLKIDN